MIFLDMFVNKLWDSHELESFPIKQLLLRVNEKSFYYFVFISIFRRIGNILSIY